MYVCRCVHMCWCTCVLGHVCCWCAYTCVNICVEARGQAAVFLRCHLPYFKAGSHWSGTYGLGRLVRKPQGAVCVCPCPSVWECKCILPGLALFYMGSGDPTQAILLTRQTLVSHLPSPKFLFSVTPLWLKRMLCYLKYVFHKCV